MKPIIYQLLPRLFGNTNTNLTINGNRAENGCGKFNDITPLALEKIKELGITHIWYTGVIEHAVAEGYPEHHIPNGNPMVIKGKAGSPYAIKDYYDIDPDLAENIDKRIEEFEQLIERTRQAGMKTIIDFVPNHLAREYHSDKKPEGVADFGTGDDKNCAFSPNNNFYYLPNEPLHLPYEVMTGYPQQNYTEFPARATGNDQFSAYPGKNDWYETVKLNYGVDYMNGRTCHFSPIPDTWYKMRDILCYWAAKGVDGFRCDMAEMVPAEFWNWAITAVKKEYPGILFIAEVYNPWLYETYIKTGKFDYLYDKVGLYDTLKGVMRSEQSAAAISDCWKNLNGLDEYMLRFLENHDEQRIASPFFAGIAEKALPAMVVSTCMQKGAVMVYFGQETGEPAEGVSGFSGNDGRTTIFDYWNVPQHQKWMNNGKFDGALLSDKEKSLRNSYVSILKLGKLPAVTSGAFYDLMWQNTNPEFYNAHRVYSFLRYTQQQKLLFVCNFDGNTQNVKVKIPADALDLMDIARPAVINFSDIQSNKTHKIGSETLIDSGVDIQLQPYESIVWEIK